MSDKHELEQNLASENRTLLLKVIYLQAETCLSFSNCIANCDRKVKLQTHFIINCLDKKSI